MPEYEAMLTLQVYIDADNEEDAQMTILELEGMSFNDLFIDQVSIDEINEVN